MELKQLLFILLKNEVFGEPIPDDVRQSLSETAITKLVSLSAKHDLSHIVISALCKIGALDNGRAENLKQQLMHSVFRDGQKEYALKETAAILKAERIPYLPLKGAVIRHLYPETWMRTSCDIDILVHKEDTEKAVSALCKAGFVKLPDQTKHDHSLMTPGGVHLELHYLLTTQGYAPQADEILNRVWEYAESSSRDCHYRMTDEMFIFYHICHMAKHFVHGGCGIRPFVDLHLLRTKTGVDTDVLDVILTEAGMKDFYDASVMVCDVWFKGVAHNYLTEQIEQYTLTGGVYGTVDNSAKVQAARGESKTGSFLKLMFLPFSSLVILYPKLKKYPILFPFYQVKRWLRVFNKEKRQKVMNLTDVRNNVKENDVNAVKHMLVQLGLANEK